MTHAATESAGTAVEVDPRLTPVARALDLHKVYGKGDTAVAALDGVTSTSRRAGSPRSWARRARASRR